MELMETGEKIGLAITIVAMLGFAVLHDCTGAKVSEEPQSAIEQVAIEQTLENKTYAPYEHVIFKRYYIVQGSNKESSTGAEFVSGGQIEIPAGYEILEIENWNGSQYRTTQTCGYDIWFINNKPVEVEPTLNESTNTYDYREPGKVIEMEFEEEGPVKTLSPKSNS